MVAFTRYATTDSASATSADGKIVVVGTANLVIGIARLTSDGQLDAPKVTQYAWDQSYIDTPVVRFQDANGDGDTFDVGDSVLYYTTDANHNVTGLVGQVLNEQTQTLEWKVVERYVYDAYGKVTICYGNDGSGTDWSPILAGGSPVSASPLGNEILYCGYRQDSETAITVGATLLPGNYQVRWREYKVLLSQWTVPDPLGYAAGDANLRRYCGNRVTSFVDPSGLETIPYGTPIGPAPVNIPQPSMPLGPVQPIGNPVGGLSPVSGEFPMGPMPWIPLPPEPFWGSPLTDTGNNVPTQMPPMPIGVTRGADGRLIVLQSDGTRIPATSDDLDIGWDDRGKYTEQEIAALHRDRPGQSTIECEARHERYLIIEAAKDWNQTSPETVWSWQVWKTGQTTYECEEQARALQTELVQSQWRYWEVGTIGGYFGVTLPFNNPFSGTPQFATYNENAVLLTPKNKNPLEPFIVDPFKLLNGSTEVDLVATAAARFCITRSLPELTCCDRFC